MWGIDIGNCSLKALRCVSSDDGQSVLAEAFDVIEYPKILSQAEPEERNQLINEALGQFLSRNTVRGDKVAMSVSGQAGLARFFKPPPVDAKMIPDIVKYEARQQIPFPLEEVIWDFQQMGGTEVDGFTLDAEVGLFAMKREQVFRSMQPFLDHEVELDIVQLAPVCIYNVIAYDVLKNVSPQDDLDPDNPAESLVVLSMGTDTTDLVVTNGARLWQRSIPLGGNHFTKQLTKELKLTYAKAEHLKRNARQAEDPKAIFQAMRPVFNDLVTEVQRSLSFFQSIDRQAKLGRMVLLGNAVKLPGLKQYLAKNLGHEFVELEEYSRLGGPSVVSSQSFQDNALSFSVCYGLCLQGLAEAKLSTNLLPREFLTERMIRDKKPWAVASVAALLLAFSFNFFFHYSSWSSVRDDRKQEDVSWKDLMGKVDTQVGISDKYVKDDKEQMDQLHYVEAIGDELVGNADRKIAWLELMKAISTALPKDARLADDPTPDPRKVPFQDRENLQIEWIESEFFNDLSTWFNSGIVKTRYEDEQRRGAGNNEESAEPPADEGTAPSPTTGPGGVAGGPGGIAGPGGLAGPGGIAGPGGPAAPGGIAGPGGPASPGGIAGPGGPAGAGKAGPGGTAGPAGAPGTAGATGNAAGAKTPAGAAAAAPADIGPKGPGWVVEIKGYHFHNPTDSVTYNAGDAYVRNTLMKNLKTGKVALPTRAGTVEEFDMKELGIDYVILAAGGQPRDFSIRNPEYVPPTKEDGKKEEVKKYDPNNPEEFKVRRHNFVVQFVWQEKPLTKRLENREKIKNKEILVNTTEGAAAGQPAPGTAPPAGKAPAGTGNNSPATNTPANNGAVAPKGGA